MNINRKFNKKQVEKIDCDLSKIPKNSMFPQLDQNYIKQSWEQSRDLKAMGNRLLNDKKEKRVINHINQTIISHDYTNPIKRNLNIHSNKTENKFISKKPRELNNRQYLNTYNELNDQRTSIRNVQPSFANFNSNSTNNSLIYESPNVSRLIVPDSLLIEPKQFDNVTARHNTKIEDQNRILNNNVIVNTKLTSNTKNTRESNGKSTKNDKGLEQEKSLENFDTFLEQNSQDEYLVNYKKFKFDQNPRDQKNKQISRNKNV